ncbi:Alpha/Beta hydrolase protein [Fusarium flagelliforme]|uniref:Dihydrolipoyllysine-residue acetyltransferase component of acetoin cleaving system n=1 Tax=Fusarium flagelliforme TaxID=2675880 RepID=A0A395MA24_9HYPO|nr:Alpha/Beta hydrolase protein [Fusarium flagelliforme]KAH7173936.1 Alpha/Beta hydrolase protein [Fusarium flagelliforme]RFN44777.1 dihydrolipoyllysine-residue acetyltransferase component of acetoin cleaving system [Fusarium flagelliforme]
MSELVLPRPGANVSNEKPISGPAETEFVKTFGALLPSAKLLESPHGKAAYYEILPSEIKGPIDRVLFIHGVQTPALGMLPLVRALEKSFSHAHLVLVDLWGHGLSDTPILPHEPALFHQLIDDLLDHLTWPSAHLVGFSFGGATTASYVVKRQERVKSYTLVAPAGLLNSHAIFPAEHMRGDDEAAAQKWILNFLEGGDLVVPTNWKERVANDEIVAEAVRDWQMRNHPGHVGSVVAIFRDGGVMDSHYEFAQAGRCLVPNLAVLGGKDDLVSEEQLAKCGFENVFVVEGAGHGVVRDRAEEVARLITDFWNRIDG